MPEISVIVINWNGKHLLKDCLSALRRQTFRDFEALLVDNGSQDGSVEFVREHFPEVTLIALEKNVGFSQGNAAAYEKSSGRLVTLLNNDTAADPAWLEEIFKASQSFPEAGSFASKMLCFDEPDRIDNCGFGITGAGFTIDLGRDEHDGPAWSTARPVFGCCGGAATYRRRMLEDIGFLDPDFFMTYEDVDLSFRAQLKGYSCMFVPGAKVLHRYRATMKKYWSYSRQIYYSQRNIEFLYIKNMPLELIASTCLQRMTYEFGSALYFLRAGAIGAFVRGKLDVLRHLPKLLRKRRDIQGGKVIDAAQLSAVMEMDWLRPKWRKFTSAWRMPRVASEVKRP